jgi:drug/metabolite transporter (DMT)-like permease
MRRMNPTGYAAGLATAVLWTFTSISFEEAGRRMGSLPVNVVRLFFALLLFVGLSFVVEGAPWTRKAGAEAWLYLSASGLVGFVLGDLLLFRAFVLVGSRLSMLIYASVPPITALIGFAFLGERIRPLGLLGMALAVAGIALAVLGKPASEENGSVTPVSGRARAAGILLALGGSVGQSVGLILGKRGSAGLDSFAATEIRAIAGLAGFLVLALAARRMRDVARPFLTVFGRRPEAPRVERRRMGGAIGFTALGSVLGPFLGVSLGLLSTQLLSAGIASTLMAVVPVLIIPIAVIAFKERVGILEIAGAVLAVAGVAALAL